jgi:uncharacterized protein
MTRQEFMLAVLAAGNGEAHEPVHVQKLFFLLDRKVPEELGGPWFAFEPSDYGPFDKAVYEELRALSARGLVSISTEDRSLRTYRLTPQGQTQGQAQLVKLPAPLADYVRRLSAWVRRLSFPELLATIYRDFPEMKAKSVFRGA